MSLWNEWWNKNINKLAALLNKLTETKRPEEVERIIMWSRGNKAKASAEAMIEMENFVISQMVTLMIHEEERIV